MNNRMWNIKNPHQGKFKKVLCVCSAGLLRSPTMARVLAEEHNYNTRAAGIERSYALIPVDGALIAWADEIVCAEEWMADAIEREFGQEFEGTTQIAPVYALNIPDNYEYMNPVLVEIIKEKYYDTVLKEQD